jgi:hypothetical protein
MQFRLFLFLATVLSSDAVTGVSVFADTLPSGVVYVAEYHVEDISDQGRNALLFSFSARTSVFSKDRMGTVNAAQTRSDLIKVCETELARFHNIENQRRSGGADCQDQSLNNRLEFGFQFMSNSSEPFKVLELQYLQLSTNPDPLRIKKVTQELQKLKIK